MSTNVDPVSLQFNPEQVIGVAMKISTDNVPETLARIENAWKSIYPDQICQYQFMDQILNRQYSEFNNIFSFLGAASFLAIFIGCLGLYGLVSFMAVQQTKEIGIRKILGATVSNIMVMFTKELVILIIVAFVIASPMAHLAGDCHAYGVTGAGKPWGRGLFTNFQSHVADCLAYGRISIFPRRYPEPGT